MVGLFLRFDDVHRNLARHLGVNLDSSRVRAFAAYRTIDLYLAFVDRDLALFFKRVGNIFARYRTEELATFADLHGDRYRYFFQLCAEKNSFFRLDLCFACFGTFFLFDIVEVDRSCFDRYFFREKHVACIRFRYLDDIVFLPNF